MQVLQLLFTVKSLRISMSKRKCKNCGEFKARETMFILGASAYCDKDAAVEWAIKNQSKGRDKIDKFERKEINKKKKSNLKTRKEAAKKACHDYIRARDSGQPCICCGKPLGNNFHAGHWQESGNNPQIRFDENNIHGQRLDCNFFKGGDSGDYQENLITKIGLEAVNKLKNLAGGTMKRTADDYRAIEKYYKDKLSALIQ